MRIYGIDKVSWLSIEFFDLAEKHRGGHGYWLGKKVFRYMFYNLSIHFTWRPRFSKSINKMQYDGVYYNHIWIGFVLIDYAT